MNKISKIFALVLALALLLSVGTVAFAQPTEEEMLMEEVYAQLYEYDKGTETLTLKMIVDVTGSEVLTMDIVNEFCSLVGDSESIDPITGISTVEIADEKLKGIDGQAFYLFKGIESVIIPDTVTEISPAAFWGCADSVVIKAEKGSAAHKFAEEYGIEFKEYSTSDNKSTEGDVKQGLVVTVLGVAVVFLILIILCIVLKVFEILFSEKKAAPAAPAPVAAAPAAPVVPVAPAASDDEELVAVISAAIAASLNVSTSRFNIKSVRRLGSSWSQAAKVQNFNNNF